MCKVTFKGKTFRVDSLGFLIDHQEWSREFAEGMAPEYQISGGLTEKHWQIIHFIRNTLEEFGKCPLVYQTCKMNGLRLRELRELFPTGYLRGACKIAGLTYKEGYMHHYTYLPFEEEKIKTISPDKIYRIDVRGFLAFPSDWDEQFAIHRAYEMKMPVDLKEMHWKIIYFLRAHFEKNQEVPTVYQTCEAFNLEINELGELFPDGYHRGAVKIAGLRVR